MVEQRGTEVQVRICGSDTNPFLALTAVFRSVLAGKTEDSLIPSNLAEAAETFKASKLVEEALGKDIQQHFTVFYENEASVSL